MLCDTGVTGPGWCWLTVGSGLVVPFHSSLGLIVHVSHGRSFLFLGLRESRFSIRRASASSHLRHVGIHASTAARHRGFDRSSLASAPLSRCSSRNFIRCFVTNSTLRRTECHEYGCPWSCVNSSVTVIHHLQRLLRCPNSLACRLQILNNETSSRVVNRFPCLRDRSPFGAPSGSSSWSSIG